VLIAGGGVEGGETGVAWRGIDTVVGTVAVVSATWGSCNIMAIGNDLALEDGCGEAFDAEIYTMRSAMGTLDYFCGT
jgi:hypothetical protein